jgi:hypothetical protein
LQKFNSSKLSRIPYGPIFVVGTLWTLWILALAVSYWLPIYTDEVVWKYHFARTAIEQNKILNFVPVCRASAFLDVPLSWWPLRFLESWFYEQWLSSRMIRLKGIVCALAISILLRGIVGMFSKPETSEFKKSLATLTLVGFGLMPFHLASNRPEQDLILGMLAIMLTSIALRLGKVSPKVALVSLLALIPITMSTHPKSVVLIPLIVFLVFRQRLFQLWAKALIVGVVLFCAKDAVTYSHQRVFCPEHEKFSLSDAGVGGYMTPQKLVQNPVASFQKMLANFSSYPDLVEGAWLRGGLGFDWAQFDGPEKLNTAVEGLGLLILLGFYLGLFFLAYFFLMDLKQSSIAQVFSSFNVQLSTVLSLTAIGFVSLTKYKPFYDVPFVFLVFMPALLLLLNLPSPQITNLRRKVIVVIAPVLALSLSVLALGALLYLPRATSREGLVSPGSILIPRGNDQREYELASAAAAKHCGFNLERGPISNLYVDESVYVYAHRNLRRPYIAAFLRAEYIPKDTSVLQVLADTKANGLIGRCSMLSSQLRSVAIREGDYCCLPAVDILKSDSRFSRLQEPARVFYKLD